MRSEAKSNRLEFELEGLKATFKHALSQHNLRESAISRNRIWGEDLKMSNFSNSSW
jgi:hypothetical protein